MHEADGRPVDPAMRYRLDPEQGPLRVLSERDGEDRNWLVTGSALLALAADEMPAPGELASLRWLARVLSHHLGPQGLRPGNCSGIWRGWGRVDNGETGTRVRFQNKCTLILFPGRDWTRSAQSSSVVISFPPERMIKQINNSFSTWIFWCKRIHGSRLSFRLLCSVIK
jgi:hypothetical protein